MANESQKQRSRRIKLKPYETEEKPEAKKGETYNVSHEQWDLVKRKYSLSDKAAIGLAAEMRFFTQKRSFIEPYYKEHCTAQNRSLEGLFEITESCGSKGVVCTNVDDLIQRIMASRGLSVSDIKLQKIGVDQGERSVSLCSGICF